MDVESGGHVFGSCLISFFFLIFDHHHGQLHLIRLRSRSWIRCKYLVWPVYRTSDLRYPTDGGLVVVQGTVVPDGYTAPKFPSLYRPSVDVTSSNQGVYLYDAEREYHILPLHASILFHSTSTISVIANVLMMMGVGMILGIWKFTLYWTLILLGGIFLLCSLLASFSLLLSLTYFRHDPSTTNKPPIPTTRSDHTKTDAQHAHHPANIYPPTHPLVHHHTPKRRRPPIWPVLVLPCIMAGVAAVVALVSGTVVGFALAAVYSAGGFNMST